MAKNAAVTTQKDIALTISKLAKIFGLSRSILLYYDAKGLLSPSGHQQGEYRIYGENELKRLEKICMYRDAGIPLKAIKKILDIPDTDFTEILSKRLTRLQLHTITSSPYGCEYITVVRKREVERENILKEML